MPRQSRLDAPGALHHIIVRGIERRNIFADDRDRCDFLDRLGAIVEETNTGCYAWALIPNHFHLLLRAPVNDHPNEATHDRLNGAISNRPKSGFRTGFKLLFFTPFRTAVFGRFLAWGT